MGDDVARMKLLKEHLTLAVCGIGALCAGMAYAQTLSTSKEPSFLRLNLDGNDAKGMRLQSKDTTLVVSFDNPTKLSAAELKAKLGSYAKNVSGDGKSFTVTLTKPYRVRQFISSNGIGFDVMDDMAPSALPKPEEKKPEPAPAPKKSEASTKPKAPKPVPQAKTPAPVAKKTAAPEQPVATLTPDEAIAQAIAPAEPIANPEATTTLATAVTTKKEPVTPVATKEQPVTQPETPAVSPKPATPDAPPAKESAPQAPLPTTTTTEPAEASQPIDSPEPPETSAEQPPSTGAATPNVPTLPIPAGAADVSTPTTPSEEAEAKPDTKPASANALPVTVQNSEAGKQFVFPWPGRVASAMFARDNEWWVVFSEPSEIDVDLLKSVAPQGITDIVQFKTPKHTVLHFATDGKIALSTSQKSGSYDWYVTVSNMSLPLTANYPVRPVVDAPKPYLLVSAFDVTPPLTFTDPVRGDRVMVIPSFEPGKAVGTAYSNAQLNFIPAVQGIALQLNGDDVTSTIGRDGIRIGTEAGLSLSPKLPAPDKAASSDPTAIASVMFPYKKWYVAPKDFADTRMTRTNLLASASVEAKPDAMYDLVTLYLGQGMAEEALSLLSRMQMRYPDYYRDNQLAMLRAGANFMIFRMGDAAADITSEELANNPETKLWKEAIGIFVPQILEPPAPPPVIDPATGLPKPQPAPPTPATPVKPGFDYIGYNKNYISHYPPSIRQKLAIIAADNFVADREFSKAARTLDILNKDGILGDIQLYAEFLLGKIAAETGKTEQAIDLWKPLAEQDKDLFIRARSAFSLATLEYNTGKTNLKDTIAKLEPLRILWRGDTLEQSLLSFLGQLYYEDQDYANALRTWREFTSNYGGTFEAVKLSKRMGELFEQLYSEGLADDMEPLKSLALFYEFRDLTPIGERGDAMIQKLADRLAKLDLLDRAAALLEHQVKFRLQGEERSRVGAQLALLHLLNKQPQKALEALEVSGYGGAAPTLAAERNRLTAMALSQVGKPAVGLEMLAADRTPKGQDLRLEILWEMQDWPNVINVAEDILGNRIKIAAPLNAKETEILIKLALAYSFEGDMTQLSYLRDYYTPLLADSPYKDIFAYVTNDTAPLDPDDTTMISRQITDTQSFLKTFRDKIAAGRLSSIGDDAAEDEAAEDTAPESLSEQNKPLVPESADPVPSETPAAATEQKPAEAAPAADAVQNAPVEVAPAPPTPSDAETKAKEAAAPFMETPEAEKAAESQAAPAKAPAETAPPATPAPVTEAPAATAAPAQAETPASPPPSQTAPQ